MKLLEREDLERNGGVPATGIEPEIDRALSRAIDFQCRNVLERLVTLHAVERLHTSVALGDSIFQALKELLGLASWRATDKVIEAVQDDSGATDLRVLWLHMRRRMMATSDPSAADEMLRASLNVLLSGSKPLTIELLSSTPGGARRR